MIEAWTEIENEDRDDLLKSGTPPTVADSIIFQRRAEWVKQTTEAWEAFHAASATPLTDAGKAKSDAAKQKATVSKAD